MSEEAWPFADPPNVAVVTLARILKGGKPILFVSHDEDDGGWQFLDGEPVAETDAMLVSLRTMFRHDPTIAGLAALPLGASATRLAAGQAWNIERKQ